MIFKIFKEVKQSAPNAVMDGSFDILNLSRDIHPYICTVFPFIAALFSIKD